MIRYLVVLYLGLVSVFLHDWNPLYALPLVLVLISFMFDRKWVGLAGVALYILVTLGTLDTVELSNFLGLILRSFIIMLPLLVLLELVLSPKPYRLERISGYPLIISTLLVIGLFFTLFAITRIRHIGIYLDTDPLLQVFILISLAIFFFGPPLLSRTGNRRDNRSGQYNKALQDKNE